MFFSVAIQAAPGNNTLYPERHKGTTMLYVLCIIAGLAVGAFAGWVFARLAAGKETAEKVSAAESRASGAEAQSALLREQEAKAAADFKGLRADLDTERQQRVRAETECRKTFEQLESEKKLLDDARSKLSDAFDSLAGKALSKSSDDFLKLARESMDKVLATAKGDLDKRQESISGLVKPLADSLKRYEEEVRTLESHRQAAYAGLTEQVKALASGQQQLQKETGNLVTALRRPEVRGRWGEITLRRVVELAGMSDHCDFTEQVSADTEWSRIRPDMLIHLPYDREIVVDAKVPLDAYLKALEAGSEQERQTQLENHAEQLRSHMKALSDKEYWKQFPTAPEFVVMFIPGESFFAAAVDCDRTLIEDSIEKRVALATPTTLMALLRVIAYGWRQQQVADNVHRMGDLGKQLYERLRVFVDHFGRVGKTLDTTVKAYNEAVGSMDSRLLPAARKFEELGASSGDEITSIEQIETTTRKPVIPDAE
jgi:DNA recombination protein RmuC